MWRDGLQAFEMIYSRPTPLCGFQYINLDAMRDFFGVMGVWRNEWRNEIALLEEGTVSANRIRLRYRI